MANGHDAQHILVDRIGHARQRLQASVPDVVCAAHAPIANGVDVLLECEQARQERHLGEVVLVATDVRERRRSLRDWAAKGGITLAALLVVSVVATVFPPWLRAVADAVIEAFAP